MLSCLLAGVKDSKSKCGGLMGKESKFPSSTIRRADKGSPYDDHLMAIENKSNLMVLLTSSYLDQSPGLKRRLFLEFIFNFNL